MLRPLPPLQQEKRKDAWHLVTEKLALEAGGAPLILATGSVSGASAEVQVNAAQKKMPGILCFVSGQ